MRRSAANLPALPPHRHPWRGLLRPRRSPDAWAAVLFLLPNLLGTATFVLLPFAETIRRSFCDALGKRFVGLANYRSVIENAAFRLAARNTARFLCTCVPVLLLCSLFLALGVQAVAKRRDGGETRRGKVFRTTFLLPMAIPVASIVILWKVLFARNGLVNGMISALGGQAVDFMGTEAAFWVLVFTYVWKNAGYDMILWLAGLDGISADLYEAASVDGANARQTFFHITLPNLLPTLTLVSVLSLLNSFKAFREAFLVGGNYPHQSMYLLQHLFNNWFLSLDLPRLTAAAVLMALALSGLILALQRIWTGDRPFPRGGFVMKAFSVFVAAAAACLFFLTGCGAASQSASSGLPAASHPESTLPPAAAPTSTPTPSPAVPPAPEAAAATEPTPEPEAAAEETLFDPDAADDSGVVVKMTDTGFVLSLTVVEHQGGSAGTAVMAEAGTSARLSVTCTEETRYIAIYADGNGNSSQAEGCAAMVQANAFVYITGSRTDSGVTADAVAILNP